MRGPWVSPWSKPYASTDLKKKKKKRWSGWISKFFRQKDFTIEWDGKIRGNGKTNVGVPQGSPLSPFVFVIYMAPILEDMDQQVSEATGLDVEVPSYVDDIMVCVLDREGVENMKEVLKEVDKVVGLVAAKWDLPLEKKKHEEIVFNQGGVGRPRRISTLTRCGRLPLREIQQRS